MITASVKNTVRAGRRGVTPSAECSTHRHRSTRFIGVNAHGDWLFRCSITGATFAARPPDGHAQ